MRRRPRRRKAVSKRLGSLEEVDAGMLTVEDACEYLKVGRTTVFKAIKEGHLQTIKIGRRTLIPRVAARQFLWLRRSGGEKSREEAKP